MGRHKISIENKNQIISVSILPQQKLFLEAHPTFDVSKYFQICMEQIINTFDEFGPTTVKREDNDNE